VGRSPGTQGEGLPRKSFAEACALHRANVSLLERGPINIRVNTALQISQVLEMACRSCFAGLVEQGGLLVYHRQVCPFQWTAAVFYAPPSPDR
jgi:hypothetical protein